MKKLIVLFAMIGSLNAQGSGTTRPQTSEDTLKTPKLGENVTRPKKKFRLFKVQYRKNSSRKQVSRIVVRKPSCKIRF